MDIQAEKIELVKLLLDEENPDVISEVKAILNHRDFYDDLPIHVIESINRGLKDIAEGNVEPNEKVMAYFKDKYGIKG